MRRCLSVVAAALLLAGAHALPAQAQAIDPATATCGELVKVAASSPDSKAGSEGQTRIGVLLLWMAGFLAPESQGSVVDFTQLEADIVSITTTCTQTPAIGIQTVAAKLWEKDQPTTPNSVDLATLRCSLLTQQQDQTAAAGVLWLIGNYASEEDTPMFDMNEIGKSVEKIAKQCATNPALSIATAAEKVLE